MADNGPIIIGQPNTGSNETRLSRDEATDATVFVVRNLQGNLNEGDGIHGESFNGTGVQGTSIANGSGVHGTSGGFAGVSGTSGRFAGVVGTSGPAYGVKGESISSTGVVGTSTSGTGVGGTTSGRGSGVSGVNSGSGTGVRGFSPSGTGVSGVSERLAGVVGSSDSYIGVRGFSPSGIGVTGVSGRGSGVRGTTSGNCLWAHPGGAIHTDLRVSGVYGDGDSLGIGVSGFSERFGVVGSGTSYIGVWGTSDSGYGVVGQAAPNSNKGGYFDGGITVVNGNKPFKIDHPLDPENRYLLHNAVESNEMKNVYDGVAELEGDGTAWVYLPDWFEALNGDFRYQLTAVGGSAPHLHVAEEISGNRFKIAGGEAEMKVCWQVTGTRKDRWAAANPFEVEQEKPEEEQGRYLDPSLYDASEEQRFMIGPVAEAVEEAQRPPEPSDIDPARLEEEHRRQLDELRRLEEEHRRLEEEHRREMEELRRRMEEQQEEAPPEST